MLGLSLNSYCSLLTLWVVNAVMCKTGVLTIHLALDEKFGISQWFLEPFGLIKHTSCFIFNHWKCKHYKNNFKKWLHCIIKTIALYTWCQSMINKTMLFLVMCRCLTYTVHRSIQRWTEIAYSDHGFGEALQCVDVESYSECSVLTVHCRM